MKSSPFDSFGFRQHLEATLSQAVKTYFAKELEEAAQRKENILKDGSKSTPLSWSISVPTVESTASVLVFVTPIARSPFTSTSTVRVSGMS